MATITSSSNSCNSEISKKFSFSNSAREREKVIVSGIKAAEQDIRKHYQFLKYQDFICALIFLGSIGGTICCWMTYAANGIQNYPVMVACILGVAFFTGILHELEHDLIHNLYFKKIPIVQDVMFAFIWLFKLHANPWMRRELHLKHHIVSGQPDDAEERLIGLGEYFGFRRVAISIHPFTQPLVIPLLKTDAKWLDLFKLVDTSAPAGTCYLVLTALFHFCPAVQFFLPSSFIWTILQPQWWWIRDLNLVWVLPATIRNACLVMMSNCSHYYGDIPEKAVFYQNQILDHWILLPFQIFCANFAATHIVHHYVPGQPFYVRTLVYHRVKAMMVDQGVRLNDFGVVARGNRFFEQMSEVAPNNSNIHSMVAWMVTAMVVGVVAFPFINLWMLVSYLIHVPIMHYEKLTAPKVSKTCENLAEKCEKSE